MNMHSAALMTAQTLGCPHKECPKGTLCSENCLDNVHRCPTCQSPQPYLHPAMQLEGEVQICSDSWHNEK